MNDKIEISFMTGDLKFKPPKYEIIETIEVKKFLIFKRNVDIWYIVCKDTGMKLGPYYDRCEAYTTLSIMKGV